jgi:ATP-binding cassette, subfamily C, bacterial LapB
LSGGQEDGGDMKQEFRPITPSGPAPAPQVAAAGDADWPDYDVLLRCLIAVTTWHDRPASEDELTAGLPLQDGGLTPDLTVRAANRAGYAAQILRKPLNRLNPLVFPAILLLENGDACVAFRKKGRRKLEIFDPHTETMTTVPLAELKQSYAGSAILIRPDIRLGTREPEAIQLARGHWFWGVVWRLWPSYMQVILAASLINVLALASPLFIMNVYDRVLPNKAMSTLWVLAAGMGLAVLFDLLFKTLRSWMIDSAGRRADVLLAGRIFEHLLSIKLQNRPGTTGSFASHLREFEQVREFFTSNTLATMSDFMFFGLFLLVIHMVGGPLWMVPAVGAAVVFFVGFIMQFPLRKAAKETSTESAYRHSLLVESISALETIKMLRAESRLQSIWERLVGRTARTLEKTKRISNMVTTTTMAVQQLVTVGIVVYGAHLFEAGEVSMGAIIASVILAGRAVAPFGQFATIVARSQQSFAALSNLNGIMKMESERPDGKSFVAQPIIDAKIEFKAVKFSYPAAPTPALNGLSFTIQPGEKVGIIGKIGSGKTTIGRLLAALYEAQEGSVLIDNIDIRQFHPHEVRRAIGVVNQDSDLFFGTLRDNIMMGKANASGTEIVEAARLAGVEDFAMRHPAGYDMPIGERGNLLSGGQRQAVALSRVLLMNPKVVFLDEPSGSMDMASERVLIKNLKQALRPDQTIIVSTHRYSMLELVDRLIVLADGKVAADGPKEKVLDALKARLAEQRG